MTEIIDLCGQALCTDDAAYSFVYPGRPRAFICKRHYAKLLTLVEALGLSVESLDVVEVGGEERSR